MSKKETFGFNTTKTPPVIEEMRVFENRMTDLIQNIEFDNHCNNDFQRQLNDDIKQINDEPKLIIKADKTTNFYKMTQTDYNSLIEKNIQKSYKKISSTQVSTINSEAKRLAEELELEDRIDTIAQRESFITLKDHKPNFENATTCRLINPCKSELGRVSKQITERIVKQLTETSKVNLWRNTNAVLGWFDGIHNKKDSTFICFDIVEFYPSITEKLLNDALDFASQHTEVSDLDRRLIKHAKQTILFNQDQPWAKKSNTLFDITMGSYDGAECCELIVVYLLSKLKELCGDAVGLYRDDGLCVLTEPPHIIERTKKRICEIFKTNGLRITIEANKKVINFLDVTLDLNRETHRPYLKPGNTPMYVNTKSNHPPTVIRAIPEGINRRLSDISSNEGEFRQSTNIYQEALDKSGHNHKLEFRKKAQQKTNNRTRKRNITWFNPPFDGKVKTNVGKEFLKIVVESFPAGHSLQQIFNRNTLKISYSCMPNMKSAIDAHNHKIMTPKTTEPVTKPCNCRIKAECPLSGKCRETNIVYQATVASEGSDQTYVGHTSTEFKARLANHRQSFKKEKHKHQTELSKYVWNLKDNHVDFNIKWTILTHAKPYSNVTKRCNLCIAEKLFIICHPNLATLNKRTELISTCRHAKKLKLKCHKSAE